MSLHASSVVLAAPRPLSEAEQRAVNRERRLAELAALARAEDEEQQQQRAREQHPEGGEPERKRPRIGSLTEQAAAAPATAAAPQHYTSSSSSSSSHSAAAVAGGTVADVPVHLAQSCSFSSSALPVAAAATTGPTAATVTANPASISLPSPPPPFFPTTSHSLPAEQQQLLQRRQQQRQQRFSIDVISIEDDGNEMRGEGKLARQGAESAAAAPQQQRQRPDASLPFALEQPSELRRELQAWLRAVATPPRDEHVALLTEFFECQVAYKNLECVRILMRVIDRHIAQSGCEEWIPARQRLVDAIQAKMRKHYGALLDLSPPLPFNT